MDTVSHYLQYEKHWQHTRHSNYLVTEAHGIIVPFKAHETLTMAKLDAIFNETNSQSLTLALVDSDSSITFYTVNKQSG